MSYNNFDSAIQVILSILGIVLGYKFVFNNKAVARDGIDFQKKQFGIEYNLRFVRGVYYLIGSVAFCLGSIVLLKKIFIFLIVEK